MCDMAELPIIPVNCCSCHLIFWITVSHDRRLRASHETFYCPSGHSMTYKGETDADRLRKAQTEIQNKERLLQAKEKELQEVRDKNLKLTHSNNGYQRFFKEKKKLEHPP